MKLDIVTIFPDYFSALDLSLVGKAASAGVINVTTHDLRSWTTDRHRTVDDTPYGGGAGMVMTPEPWGRAFDDIFTADTHLIVPSPSGIHFTQALADEWAHHDHLVFACGRYEGIDARVVDYARTAVPVHEVSLGDYVLNGGEVAALAIIEAIVRLIPGVVGNPDSLVEESHSTEWELLEYPNFTRPASWRGFDVPEILLSGHHAAIASWRREQAVARTQRVAQTDAATSKRPDAGKKN